MVQEGSRQLKGGNEQRLASPLTLLGRVDGSKWRLASSPMLRERIKWCQTARGNCKAIEKKCVDLLERVRSQVSFKSGLREEMCDGLMKELVEQVYLSYDFACSLEKGPVEKWEGSDKNFRNWPKIKWPIYIINH